MKKKDLKTCLKWSMGINILLLIPLAIYLFTPVLDEWLIEHSLKRHCDRIQEEFQGESFSPAYLCTFLDPEA